MTAPKRWPSTAKMRALFNAGATFNEIAEYVYRSEPGWDEPPDRSTIKKYYDRIGMPPRRPTSASAKKLIPWQVTTEHNTHLFRHMLGAEARKREHKPVSETDRKLLTRMHEMLFGRGTLLVFDYDVQTGWCLRLREDFDADIIRAPVEVGALRLDVRTALRDAPSDKTMAQVARREGVTPAVLDNAGHPKAASLLRSLMQAEADRLAAVDEYADPGIGGGRRPAARLAEPLRALPADADGASQRTLASDTG